MVESVLSETYNRTVRLSDTLTARQ